MRKNKPAAVHRRRRTTVAIKTSASASRARRREPLARGPKDVIQVTGHINAPASRALRHEPPARRPKGEKRAWGQSARQKERGPRSASTGRRAKTKGRLTTAQLVNASARGVQGCPEEGVEIAKAAGSTEEEKHKIAQIHRAQGGRKAVDFTL